MLCLLRSQADSNRCARFCRPVTKPLIHATRLSIATAKVAIIFIPTKILLTFLKIFLEIVSENVTTQSSLTATPFSLEQHC